MSRPKVTVTVDALLDQAAKMNLLPNRIEMSLLTLHWFKNDLAPYMNTGARHFVPATYPDVLPKSLKFKGFYKGLPIVLGKNMRRGEVKLFGDDDVTLYFKKLCEGQ